MTVRHERATLPVWHALMGSSKQVGSRTLEVTDLPKSGQVMAQLKPDRVLALVVITFAV
jgi:hypothetical protein